MREEEKSIVPPQIGKHNINKYFTNLSTCLDNSSGEFTNVRERRGKNIKYKII